MTKPAPTPTLRCAQNISRLNVIERLVNFLTRPLCGGTPHKQRRRPNEELNLKISSVDTVLNLQTKLFHPTTLQIAPRFPDIRC